LAKPPIEPKSESRGRFTSRHGLGVGLACLAGLLILMHDRLLDVCDGGSSCKTGLGLCVGVLTPALLVAAVWLFVARPRKKARRPR
jgi:hypothetical protein